MTRPVSAAASAFILLMALPVPAAQHSDTAEARALFEKNLDAIRKRDRSAYLACYLESETLARPGPGGLALGYEGLAKNAGENWPDTFDASDLELVSLKRGVVYGTYRYRVRYGADEQTGISQDRCQRPAHLGRDGVLERASLLVGDGANRQFGLGHRDPHLELLDLPFQDPDPLAHGLEPLLAHARPFLCTDQLASGLLELLEELGVLRGALRRLILDRSVPYL